MNLSNLPTGKRATILSSSHYLCEMGLTPGTIIQMIRQGHTSIIKVGCKIWAIREGGNHTMDVGEFND